MTGERAGGDPLWARLFGRRALRSARTDTAKVELYTRYTFQSLAGVEAGTLAFPQLIGERQPSGSWLFVLLLAHSLLSAVLCGRALDWRLGRRERPVALVVAFAALSGGCVLALLLFLDTGALGRKDGFGLLLMGVAAFGLGTLALGLGTTRQRVYAVLGGATATSAVTAALGMGGQQIWLNFLGIVCPGVLFVVTYVFSAWLAEVVRQLDATHELQIRLAVAEERLRFGRDLHDVMGRNLAVMALKSELAVQLAERGRPEAVAQMAEVQRIARESQREVREVVRGYREVDLRTELEGALSVLKAAGIDCAVHGLGGDGERALPPELQSALGWVVREATTNVLRHGDPQHCTIRLSRAEQEEVVLMVQNDGLPEPDDSAAGCGSGTGMGSGTGAGSGLAGLRERLAAHGGTLEAGPDRSEGCFRLTARLPLPPPGTGHAPGSASVSAASADAAA